MSFKEISSLDADVTIRLGGIDKKTRKENPTTIEGYFLGTREVNSTKSKSGKASLHVVQTAKGNVAVWGKTDMDRKLAAVNPGTMARISFDRMVPTPNGDMYKYKVEVDNDNTIVVSAPNASASQAYGGEGYDDNSRGEDTDDTQAEDDDYTAPAPQTALSAQERAKKVQDLLKTNKR